MFDINLAEVSMQTHQTKMVNVKPAKHHVNIVTVNMLANWTYSIVQLQLGDGTGWE